MKYLSHYTEKGMSELFKNTGAFFAFSNSQYEEGKKENVEYISMGSGMLCPKNNAKELAQGLETIVSNGIVQDIKENGIKAIIHRELGNHEAQITMALDDTIDALIDYPITENDILSEWKEYYAYCVANDYF